MISTVMYRNPLEEWWWESGLAYWAIVILACLVLGTVLWSLIATAIQHWRSKR